MNQCAKDLTEMFTLKNTENGAIAYSTLCNKIIDMFALIGGKRNAPEEEIIKMYHEAREQDKDLADKLIFYTRDILGGLGERRIGRILLKEFATIDPEKCIANFDLVHKYGRWDDFYSFEDTPCEKAMWQYLYNQLNKDFMEWSKDKPISLLAKWLKSENASSAESKRLAKKFCRINHMSPVVYRKILSALRKYLDVTETKMAANAWNNIDFQTVPSIAHKNYVQAFKRHCGGRYNQYLDAVAKGEQTLNAKTLTPADIVHTINFDKYDEKIIDLQWKSLPDYFTSSSDILCCADVSGSMIGRPLEIAVGLTMYCAERNNGAYKNKFLTFTDIPTLYTFDNNASIKENYCKVMSHVGYNTNLDGMFEAIYEAAAATRKVPEALIIISDMEIDYFLSEGKTDDIISKWNKKFEAINLPFMKVVFWNAEARGNTFLSKLTNPYARYISGSSATLFSELDTIIHETQFDAIVRILNRYNLKG